MNYKAGFVGLIGLPNSGKSTLMNAMVGEKVSIVTSKPQTTRRRAMGLITDPNYQIIFVDAPGVVRAQSGLNKFLHAEAEDVISQSDVLVAVLNIDERRSESLQEIIDLVSAAHKPWIALIHKTDLPQVHRPQILRDKLSSLGVDVIQGSSLTEPGVLREILIERLLQHLPAAEAPLYDSDLYTLSTTRDLCSEIIREKCFENLHQEVPFGLAVKVLQFNEDEGAVIKVHSEILVAKENHRPIVIGKDGVVLKKIGTEARQEMEKLTGRKIYLDLRVASKRGWQKNPGLMKELGYVLPKA